MVELDGVVAGFIFTIMDAKRKTGEIGLNAVDGRGIGRAMHEFALKDLKERGAQIACVGTSGVLPMHRHAEPLKLLASTRRFPACTSSMCYSAPRVDL